MSSLTKDQVSKLWQANRMLEQAAELIEMAHSKDNAIARKVRDAVGEVAHELDTYDALGQ